MILNNLKYLKFFVFVTICLKRILLQYNSMRYNNLIIIGTSHVAKQSLDEVESVIKNEKPDIIALELDEKRFYSLLQKRKEKKKGRINIYNIKKVGIKGWVFSLIGAWVEKKIGRLVGIDPGSEMIKAIKLARKENKKIALIDQNIELTLKRFSKELTWKEKFNFAVDILKAPFSKKEVKELGIDLTKVPEKKIIDILLKKVKKRYPSVYKVLIHERNKVMAVNLRKLIKGNPDKKILAIVGAGHEEEIKKILSGNSNSITITF